MTEERPWGKFEVLLDAEDCKVKRITVKKGQRLSYQSHEHRSETWTVVKGRAVVTLDGGDQVLEERETVYIPQGTKHRVSNATTVVRSGVTLDTLKEENSDLVFIEVQHGTYFGEDDIVRYEDDYNRE